MTDQPIDVTREVFQRFGRGDVPAILELLSEEIRIEFYGPAVIPYAGTYDGRADAQRFFDTVLGSVDVHRFEPQQFLCDGDVVTVTGELHLTARTTGRSFGSAFAHVITVADGRWVRFRDFMDTAAAAAAFAAD